MESLDKIIVTSTDLDKIIAFCLPGYLFGIVSGFAYCFVIEN